MSRELLQKHPTHLDGESPYTKYMEVPPMEFFIIKH